MDDQVIIDLYWARSEEAIKQSDQKYGSYCQTIAYNITHSLEDAKECRSDTWLQAWQAIPPAKPTRLLAFFAKITRNLAIDVNRRSDASKRRGVGQVLMELDDVVAQMDSDSRLQQHELVSILNQFLEQLPNDQRQLFVRRYFLVEPIEDLAKRYHQTPSQVATRLFRLRQGLRQVLQREEIEL